MTQELKDEFERYLEDIAAEAEPFSMPEYLTDYEIVACIQDNPQKKTFLLRVKNGRKILCKYATGEFRTMLKTELEVADTEPFPFFPYVIDYRETEEGSVLLREYIEGRTLKELVDEEGTLCLAEALPIMQSVCHCLMRLHDATPALIHRDIKPSNIVLTKSGDCYLVDMGTSRRYQEGNESDTICMGTADFAAPEQFGARQTDVRTDIYAIGALFYYLLTGRSKVQEASFSGIPRPVVAFIKKCSAFNPNDRYADIHQVQKALNKLSSTQKPTFCQVLACTSTVLFLAVLTALIVPMLHIGKNTVTFSSPLLEQAVRRELGKYDGETVYQKDLQRITRLEICGNMVMDAGSDHNYYAIPLHSVDGTLVEYGNISDISLLAQMPNLSKLTLDYQEIVDITPLKGLPLVSLSLTGNPISDLSALSGCDTLCELNLSYTKVQSLEPLADCGGLQILFCVSTPVKSLAPLADSGLTQLHMLDTIIADYAPLENVPLTVLDCSHITAESLENIKKIKTLRHLSLCHSNFSTLEEFDGLENLAYLFLNYCALKSLDGIENVPNLTMLSVCNNPISDCPPIPSLRDLTVNNTGIRDFSFLNEMPALSEITIAEAQHPYLQQAVPKPWFKITYAE